VRAVDFTAHGSLLASAGLDGTVRLWNMADPGAPTPLGSPLTGHSGTIWALTSAPDRSDHVMNRTCFITGGGLSGSEWESYAPGLEYVDVCKA
jgi:WD40 repeat protein